MKTKHRSAATAKRAHRWQADPRALHKVLARTETLTPGEVQQLALPARVAWESLRGGHGEQGDFDTLAAALNIALVRAEAIDPLCERTCIDAQGALMRTHERYGRTGRWGVDGPALQAIPPALDLHDQMLELSTPAQIEAAGLEVMRRIRAGEVITTEDPA